MGDGAWNAKGLSPFLSERARSRAPQVLSYAAVTGAAMLVSPSGEIALFSGAAAELDLARVARVASGRSGGEAITSFMCGTACVHAAPVCMGWTLCLLSTAGVYPGLVLERLRRASAVLAMALVDGPSPRSGGGDSGNGAPPAEAFAARLPTRRN